MSEAFDLAVIGGGINGCGIARDAAGRGASVFLCEMNDLASGTSSWSTKLIHGGLRYLEYFEFRLVREALLEREVLWRLAPHIVRPLRIVLPHHQGLRPAWLLRLGLFLYDHLGTRKLLPASRFVDLSRGPLGAPLKPGISQQGFEYSDCSVDDARLVVLNARDAADRGAVIRPRVRAIKATREDAGWTLTVENTLTGAQDTVRSRALVNAAGPWVENVLTGIIGSSTRAKVRLVQGSHIVVPRLYDHDRAYIFQNADGRIVFAIPYEGDFTLIGTTDRDYHGDPAHVAASDDEVAYLCAVVSDYFARAVTPSDVVWKYSGVRPLYDDGASEAKAATRDYVFELDTDAGATPLLSIFGGKITTYRRLAEAALERLRPYIPTLEGKRDWTDRESLPGGDFDVNGLPNLAQELVAAYPFVEAGFAGRLVQAYGTRARTVLGMAANMEDLGRQFGATLTEAELRYLMQHEWARTAEDVLWRRSKLGLRMTADNAAQVEHWMQAHLTEIRAPASAGSHGP
ncbi:MAG TPA: glycerol-3-phosphate dehydrogenase [Dongiaceae bacterium]|nr:glycerol-3-phosphate dehydrogenase [Dongiaceae bacterium]